MQYGTRRSASTAIPAIQIVLDDPKVVDGYVRELWAAGTFPDRPDIGRGRLQPLIDANITASVQLDPSLVEPDPGGVWNAPCCDQDIAALDLLLAGGRARHNTDLFTRPAVHTVDFGRRQKLNAFVAEDPLHFIRDVGILPAYQPGSGLDDRHAAAKAPVSLRQFETDKATSQHDQLRRQIVELESFDVRQRPGGIETGNGWYRRMRANIKENLVAREHSRPAIVEANLQRLRRHKASVPNDQLGAGRHEILQMQIDLAPDHIALAAQNRSHVGRDGTGRHAKL
jgi:hypothetical protein